MLHPTAHHRYGKLERVGQPLLTQISTRMTLTTSSLSQTLYPNSFVTTQIPAQHSETRLRDFWTTLIWKFCREIANQQKHFRRPTRPGSIPLMVKAISVRRGTGGVLDVTRMRVVGAADEISFAQADGHGTERTCSGMAHVDAFQVHLSDVTGSRSEADNFVICTRNCTQICTQPRLLWVQIRPISPDVRLLSR